MKCRTKTAKQKKAPPKGEKIMAKRVFIIVLDSFGIGEMPDAARFGDVGSNTLGAIVKSPKYHTPTLQKLGLFNIEGVVCGRRAEAPLASFARRFPTEKTPRLATGKSRAWKAKRRCPCIRTVFRMR